MMADFLCVQQFMTGQGACCMPCRCRVSSALCMVWSPLQCRKDRRIGQCHAAIHAIPAKVQSLHGILLLVSRIQKLPKHELSLFKPHSSSGGTPTGSDLK